MEWDDDDRQKAIAFEIEKNSKCQLCGTAEWEWEENKRAYEPYEHHCMGCYYKAILQEESGQGMPGTTISLIPTGSIEHAKMLTGSRTAMER